MQKNQNVLLFYVRVLLYCLVALLIRAAALAPLAALFILPLAFRNISCKEGRGIVQ